MEGDNVDNPEKTAAVTVKVFPSDSNTRLGIDPLNHLYVHPLRDSITHFRVTVSPVNTGLCGSTVNVAVGEAVETNMERQEICQSIAIQITCLQQCTFMTNKSKHKVNTTELK